MLVITVHHVTYPVCVLVIVGGKEMTVVQVNLIIFAILQFYNLNCIVPLHDSIL